MIELNEIENIEFIHMGSRWFNNKSDTIRIRQWENNEIDVYKWLNDEDNEIVFRGKIFNIDELSWVIERVK